MEFVNKMLKDKGGSQAALMQGVASLISNQGGLSGLLSKFNGAGLGGKAQSWVSTGPNEPVSGSEVRQALGDDQVDQVAQQAGLPREEAADHIASMLPQTVDQLTPQGQIPDQQEMQKMMQSLTGL